MREKEDRVQETKSKQDRKIWGKWKDIEDRIRRPEIILNREPEESVKKKGWRICIWRENHYIQIVKATKWIHN